MYNFSNMFNNSFMGYYVDSYNDVLNYAAPTDGSAVLFANLQEGLIWSKKMVNGIPMIQPYRIMPINQEGTPQKPQTTTDEKLDTLINLLLKKEGTYEPNGSTTNAS